MISPYDQYVENSALTATPLELVNLLYRCGLESVSDAIYCIEQKDIEGRGRAVNRAFDVLSELIQSLDLERGGDIANNLLSLYTYCQQRVLQGHIDQTAEPFLEVENLMRTLKEAWNEIAVTAEAAA